MPAMEHLADRYQQTSKYIGFDRDLDKAEKIHRKKSLLAQAEERKILGADTQISSFEEKKEFDPRRLSFQEAECMICLYNKIEVALPQCGHAFCRTCSLDDITGQIWQECPLCMAGAAKKAEKEASAETFELIDPEGKDDVSYDIENQVKN